MFGIADEENMVWDDTERHIVYHIYSEDTSPEELPKIAQSIVQQD